MKLLGFSAQKPLYQAWQQDATLVRTWEADIYPAICTEANVLGTTTYTVNAETFREFLKRLLIGAIKPVLLIVAGHPIHKAKLIKTFVEAQNGQLPCSTCRLVRRI